MLKKALYRSMRIYEYLLYMMHHTKIHITTAHKHSIWIQSSLSLLIQKSTLPNKRLRMQYDQHGRMQKQKKEEKKSNHHITSY